jgi:hypothetical protein
VTRLQIKARRTSSATTVFASSSAAPFTGAMTYIDIIQKQGGLCGFLLLYIIN